jgi:hypothetical protein
MLSRRAAILRYKINLCVNAEYFLNNHITPIMKILPIKDKAAIPLLTATMTS